MNDLRILSHGKITELSSGFSLGGSPFSINVVPKNTTTETSINVSCRCICDKESSELPVLFYNWSPALIQEIPSNAIDLSDYDVYWGAGEIIK